MTGIDDRLRHGLWDRAEDDGDGRGLRGRGRGTGAGAEAPATKDRGSCRARCHRRRRCPRAAQRGARREPAARPFAKAFASRRDRAPVRGLSLRASRPAPQAPRARWQPSAPARCIARDPARDPKPGARRARRRLDPYPLRRGRGKAPTSDGARSRLHDRGLVGLRDGVGAVDAWESLRSSAPRRSRGTGVVGAPAGVPPGSRKTSKGARVENPRGGAIHFVARDDRVFLSVREPSPARGWETFCGVCISTVWLADIFRINRP